MASNKLKLTDLEIHLLRRAQDDISKVLRRVKLGKLTSPQVTEMQVIEHAVQSLEVVTMSLPHVS